MLNTQFEVYKLKRELKRSGIKYTFNRKSENDVGEPIGKSEEVGQLVGLYHEQSGYVSVQANETTRYRQKKTPMILCLYEDAMTLGLKVGDEITINSKTLKVTAVTNIQEWNIISDISLEAVDNGNKN